MSNTQFVEAMAVASALNTLSVVVGIVFNNSKLVHFRANVEVLFGHANEGFGSIDPRFDAIDRRFDEMRDICMTELRPVRASDRRPPQAA